GSRKRFEVIVDPDEPFIIIDDSVSSGLTMTECSKLLEKAGLFVEGGLCLVRFGWYGGIARILEGGYHMESLYDIYSDFMHHMDDEPEIVLNPTKTYPAPEWNQQPAPEGLHPAQLAMQECLKTGHLPQAPRSLDRHYDSSGGIWISVRSKQSIYNRRARDGFWHFPGETTGSVPQDLLLAAYKTARGLPSGEEGLQALDQSGIAVTFFSRLEECRVGELDNNRYGIVVCSRERLGRMGGALPRMPGMANAWQQFQHARRKNAGLVSFEPFRVFRHEVVKSVEPGIVWQPTGVPKPDQAPWYEDPEKAGRIARRARQLVLAALAGEETQYPALEDGLSGPELDTVFISIYSQGGLTGCMGAQVENLDEDLQRLARSALTDDRFPSVDPQTDPGRIAVSVSLLCSPLDLGSFSAQEVMQRVRLGQQALAAYQGNRRGLLLPECVARFNLSPLGYALEVIDKAGITRSPYGWKRWECATWLDDGGSEPRQLMGGFPATPPSCPPPGLVRHLADLFCGYLLRHQKGDGVSFFRYQPIQDVLYERLDLMRLAHGAWVMARAGRQLDRPDLQQAARRTVDFLIGRLGEDGQGDLWVGSESPETSIAETSFLLLALCNSDLSSEDRQTAQRLAQSLKRRIGRHGRIETHRQAGEDLEAYQDYFPGQLLLALAAAREAGLYSEDVRGLEQAFRFYRHRFRYKRHFGQVSWMMQAFSAWWHLLQRREHADFVFEIADWLLEYQQRQGGFINDHQPDAPGFTTALYLEGLGAALGVAVKAGRQKWVQRCSKALDKGFVFVDRLVIQDRDQAIIPNLGWARGGLRRSVNKSEVRIDFVQHGLSAALGRIGEEAEISRKAAKAQS
ncbi:MAG: AMMECR1 domain-containing protein, partial [Acidobacteriota bacterium]